MVANDFNNVCAPIFLAIFMYYAVIFIWAVPVLLNSYLEYIPRSPPFSPFICIHSGRAMKTRERRPDLIHHVKDVRGRGGGGRGGGEGPATKTMYWIIQLSIPPDVIHVITICTTAFVHYCEH